jgi:hypothetical protein
MKKLVPSLKIYPVTYGQFADMYRHARKFAHMPLWDEILDDRHWKQMKTAVLSMRLDVAHERGNEYNDDTSAFS